LLARLLEAQGIDSVVLEQRDRDYVEHRVRAGVLEHGSAETLREAGVGTRMDAEGLPHDGTNLRFELKTHRLDFAELTGRNVTVYGQQEVVKDLIKARLASGGELRFEVNDVALQGLDSAQPTITFEHQGNRERLECDFVIGADGFHGISRGYIPNLTAYERTYPFAWLGILAEAPPSSAELIYARHANGFALHSMRSPTVTRMYLQVAPDESVDAWSDDRIWAELHTRLADDSGFVLSEGPIISKGITPMRSFVATPMQHGRLYLAGDAAHIVPPTGAKGMNLAIADVRLLARALGGYYTASREDLLAEYSETAGRRVWRATHFSWWMTTTLHRAPDADPFDEALALSQLNYVVTSRAMATALAENYTGLPYEYDWFYRAD
jgi:p-hydroxybenzoate 3-monooxygenase